LLGFIIVKMSNERVIV